MTLAERLRALSLRERLSGLEERERRLLGIALVVAVLGAVFAPPIALYAVLHGRRGDVEALRSAIVAIDEQSETIERAKAQKGALEQRYARPAPQLQAFLAKLAGELAIEIPESQDRAAIPRGKRFDERSTKLTLRKVGMLKLVRFLERIDHSGHPVKVLQIDIRKRTEPDAYDVDMIVSAFDRKAEPKSAAKADRDGGAGPASSADSESAAEEKPKEESP